MDKEQIIAFIQSQLQQNKITREELITIAGGNVPSVSGSAVASTATQEQGSNNLITVFYIIGAVIVLIGVIILIAQNWNDIGFIGRVGSTLGIALATYVAAMLLSKTIHNALSQIMFMVSAVLAPMGVFVFLDELNINFDISTQIIVALSLAVVYGFAQFVARKNILVLIVIGFATWAYYAFLVNIFDEQLFNNNVITWATMLLGISYICIAYGYASLKGATADQDTAQQHQTVSHVLYAAGTLAALGAGIVLGDIWDLLYIPFIFGIFYLSVFFKSRAMLVLAAIFLVAHMIKLTSEYFLDSVGWPLALIGCGFAVIGIGYMTFYVNRKYISKKV